MANHSVVEAKNKLSDLIDRALKGESVVITRHGNPVVKLKPVQAAAKPVSPKALDWLAERRAKRRPVSDDAGSLMSTLRDEWDR